MPTYRFPVEMGHVLAFARAIGDHNPAFVGADEAAAGCAEGIAPPTFVAASAHFDPDYPLRPRPGQEWVGDPSQPPTSPSGSRLLAERHFDLHRPVRVGETLTVETRDGRSWQKAGRRGTLEFAELIADYFDDDGVLVVTQKTVFVTVSRQAGEEPGNGQSE